MDRTDVSEKQSGLQDRIFDYLTSGIFDGSPFFDCFILDGEVPSHMRNGFSVKSDPRLPGVLQNIDVLLVDVPSLMISENVEDPRKLCDIIFEMVDRRHSLKCIFLIFDRYSQRLGNSESRFYSRFVLSFLSQYFFSLSFIIPFSQLFFF
jgi:hypothetical protein